MQKWISVAESLPPPLKAVEAPKSVPTEARAPLDEGKYMIFTLEEQGADPNSLGPCLFPGGETEGLRRMEKHLAKKVCFLFHYSVLEHKYKSLNQVLTLKINGARNWHKLSHSSG